MNSRYRLPLFILALAALVAAFAIAPPGEVAAQDNSYVDLVMLYAYDSNEVAYSVQNNGTATATGVTVSFLLENLETSLDIPSITDKMTEDGTNQSFTWEVGTLPPGGASKNLTFSTWRHSSVTTIGEVGVINATASSFSPEPDTLLANNVRKVYTYFASSSGSTLHMRGNTLALLLSVDDLQPAPGGDVDLDLTARNVQGAAGSTSINLIADAEVKVELSQGLQFKDGWTPPAAFVKSGSQSATWSPPDTDTRSLTTTIPATQKIEDIEIQLTSDTLADIPLKERCITARVTDSIPPPTPGYVLGSLTRCLGDDPLVLFEENQLDLFTLEVTAQNDLELVARANLIQQMQIRSRGIGRGSDNFMPVVILSPERTIIQVKDSPSTRGSVTDNSVTSMTWQTKGGDVDRGVEVRENIDDILPPSQQNNASTVWTSGKDKLTATGIDGGSKPGTLRIFIADESFKLADADNTGFTSNADAYDFGGGNGMVTGVVVLHFGELGTYKVGKAYKGTHNTAGEKTTSDETYIFHVGPIAELEVRDAGGNPEVLDSQRAYTIIAMNNGPDDPPSAQVTVTGLNAGDYVSHNATVGSFDSGTGIWTIGELKNRESYQAKYGRDGEVLTIITSAAVDTEITAAISNTQDYEVCIDSSGGDVVAADESACTGTAGNTWHTAKYYDYISDNDSATIKAKDGTGAALPSPRSAEAKTAAIVVSWNEVPDVNERPVTHYEVQKETNPWVTVADDVTGTTYVDTDVAEGATHRYRLRAVNDQDQKGPWSQPIEGSVDEVDTQVRTVTRTIEPEIEPPGRPTGMQVMPIGATELLVFWSTPAGSIVDHYQLQVSMDGGAHWEDLDDSLMANSYNHTGLQEGDTRHYRVRAWNTDDPQEEGPWSETVSATTGDSPTVVPPPQIITPSRSRDDDDDDYAHFATLTTTRSVVENSAAGSPVGNPVVAVSNRGNRVTYYLEGEDSELFDIEPDSGQILVGEDLVLDHEGGPDSYAVVVVGDPRRGSTDRVTVTITVIDAPETASLTLSPEGMPQVGQELAAAIEHSDGPEVEMVVVSWQWQRSADGLAWTVIEGADDSTYTPTVSDAGYRLRVIVTYSPPGSDGLILTGLVTQPLPGELASPSGSETPETIIPAPPGTGTAGDANAGAVSLILLPATGPQVGEPLAAVLSGDGAPSWSSWQWQRSLDGVTWQDIQGAVADHYYRTDADAGHLLRVIYTYVPAGSVNPMLVGALTERLPGDPPQPAPASLPHRDPTPMPVAAATPVPAPVPTPVPALAPTPAPTAVPEPAATATPAPLLVTASSLASRGVGIGGSMGGNQPASEEAGEAATPAQTTESPLASQGDNVTPLEHPMAVDPPPPSPGAEAAAQEGGRETLVWVVLTIFAALVASGGSVYYYLRLRRR